MLVGSGSNRSRNRFIRRTATAAGLALAAGFALGGCAPSSGNPGEALRVGDTVISENDLTVAIDQFAQLAGQEVPRDQMAAFLGQGLSIVQAAEDVDLGATDEDLEQAFNEAAEQLGAQQEVTLEFADVAPSTMIIFSGADAQQKLMSGAATPEQMALFEEVLADTPVYLNPRYGQMTLEEGYQPPGPLGDAVGLAGP